MPARAKRASHIDPPKSPGAIMRRAWPERGENSGPGKDVTGSLTPDPELENSQGQKEKTAHILREVPASGTSEEAA